MPVVVTVGGREPAAALEAEPSCEDSANETKVGTVKGKKYVTAVTIEYTRDADESVYPTEKEIGCEICVIASGYT